MRYEQTDQETRCGDENKRYRCREDEWQVQVVCRVDVELSFTGQFPAAGLRPFLSFIIMISA